MDDDDENKPIELRPRIPPVGDSTYDGVFTVRTRGRVLTFDSKAGDAVDALISDGHRLSELAHVFATRQESCAHLKTFFEKKKRTLLCQDCGKQIDPYYVLYMLAEHDYFMYRNLVNRDDLDRAIKTLRGDYERIKKTVAGEKSKLNRARKSRTRVVFTLPERDELERWRELGEGMWGRTTWTPADWVRMQEKLRKMTLERLEAEADIDEETA